MPRQLAVMRVDSTALRHAAPPPWPALPLEEWQDTQATVHRWTQMLGKTRLWLAPFENHWWHCALRVTPHGVSTSPMPFPGGSVEIELDFLADRLLARTSSGAEGTIPLTDQSVASFYRDYRALLDDIGVHVFIYAKPAEIADATPFADDVRHAQYDGDWMRRCWRILLDVDRLLNRFASDFAGKSSRANFWWGGFDIARTRFSGRAAPPYPTKVPNCPSYVMTEGYSRECISAGWWPGSLGSPVPFPAFYAYAYPVPEGCPDARVTPSAAFYEQRMGEWILPYDAVRDAADPDTMVLDFFESTYQAAAKLAHWDIDALRASDLARHSSH